MLKSYTRSITIISTPRPSPRISMLFTIPVLTTVIQVEHGYRMAAPQGCAPALYDIMLECWHKVSTNFSHPAYYPNPTFPPCTCLNPTFPGPNEETDL